MTKKKFLGFLAVIILVIVLGAVELIGQHITGVWEFWTWGKADTAQSDQNDNEQNGGSYAAIDGNGNLMREGVVYAMPAGITFMTTKATTTPSVTVRAILKPANADDKRVTWTSSDPDQVTVTPDVNDSRIATITCRTALTFGAEYVTCTSVDNPAVKAVCRIDYFVRGDDVEFSAGIVGNPDNLVFGQTYSLYTDFSPSQPGVGTCCGQADNVSSYISLTNEFGSLINSYLAKNGYKAWFFDPDGNTTIRLGETPYECFCDMDIPKDIFNNAFKLAARECSNQAFLAVDCDYVYNGKTYGSNYHYQFKISFSISEIWVDVEDIELDNDNAVFGK